MAHGTFVIQVRSGAKPWGELTLFEYDDQAKFRRDRRIGALDHTLGSIVGWQRNYHAYRDAEFRVMEHRRNGEDTVVNMTREIDALLRERGRREERPRTIKKAETGPARMTRKQWRRAAKKLCREATGNHAAWRDYLNKVKG